MGKIHFRYLENKEKKDLLPKLFQILYTNMSQIAPSEATYEEDESAWLSYIIPELESGRTRMLLIYARENLAGYFQYRLTEDTLCVDEVEICQKYHRSMVFYRLCRHLLDSMPEEIKYLDSYVNVNNSHSISIHEGLGMVCVGKNKRGTSLHFRGEAARAAERFRRNKR